MLKSPRKSIPPVGLGPTSVVLGTIGLLLFFLPVLGVPIAVCGLTLATVGAISTLWRPNESLRWILAGFFCSLASLGVGLAINYAPVGEEPRPDVPPLWQQSPVAPFVPPPANPGFMEGYDWDLSCGRSYVSTFPTNRERACPKPPLYTNSLPQLI